jgi:D-methionine transport system permease protein
VKFSDYITKYLPNILADTLYVVFVSAILAIIMGMLVGAGLFLLRKGKSKPVKIAYKILDVIVNIFRSFPFYILIFWLLPFTRIVMKLLTGIGTSMSTDAFIVPLTVAAIPFFSKLIENALIEVNSGIIEAATSLGLSTFQIIVKVVLREALPAIVSGITLGIVTLIGFSAMSGVVGGTGLGQFAIDYGLTNYDSAAMGYAVLTLIVLVLSVQLLGNLIYKLVK